MSLCLAQLRSGDHIICSSDVFGSTVVLLNNFFAKFGVEISYVKLTDMAAWRAAIKDNTRFLFIETPSNPLSQVGDIAAFADLPTNMTYYWWLIIVFVRQRYKSLWRLERILLFIQQLNT